MKNRVITISREFGSGGRTIGKKVAQALGIPCYDSELLQKIAVESGFNENYIKDAGEYAPSGFLSAAFSHRGFGPTNADYLWEIQYKIITELAEQGPCVIVGRCAAYHRFYTDMKWGHAQNYDVTLNSGTLGIDKCVEIIRKLY